MPSPRSNRRQPVAKRTPQATAAPVTAPESHQSLSPIVADGDPRGWLSMLTAAFVLLCVAGVTLLLMASAGNA